MKGKKTASNERKILAKNIQRLLDSKGKTQTDMARELGFAETTVSSWMNCERYPRIDKIQQMADYFGVYRSDITDDKNKIPSFTSSKYNYLPTAISAGLPLNVDGITESETISIPDAIMGKYAGNKEMFITKVNGESMNKVIPHNSLIAVKPTPLETLKNGDIVVYKYGSEYAVKRFYRQDNKLIFRPDSTDITFTDLVIDLEHNDLDVKIEGKVVLYIVELD